MPRPRAADPVVWLLKRIGQSVFLIWLVASLVFLALRMVPGDPAELLLSQGGSAPTEAAVAALRARLGLDQPILTQYLANFAGLVQWDLGRSLLDGSSVSAEIARRLPRTLEVIAVSAVLSVIFGVTLGTLAALNRGGWFDRGALLVSAVLNSIPVFVSGTLIILVFSQLLKWLPAGGFVAFGQNPGRHVLLLMMPAVSIALGLSAVMLRITRSSVLDVLGNDHVRAARAKGIGEGRLIRRHVVYNALIPVVTVLGLNMGTLLGGTVLVEFTFNWPGLSGLLIGAVGARDYPMVMGVVLVISILFVLINLLVELIYALLDPRVMRA